MKLYLHIGITGRISTPDTIPQLESLSNENISYPLPNTYLTMKSTDENKTIKELHFQILENSVPFV